MTASDHELLSQYARNGSQTAFAELVQRHLNLVYSAARRHVSSSALAEEIAQSVFLDLSRNAMRIKPGTPLVAWLHVVTRRTAIDVIRRESRRQAREQTAVEMAGSEQNESVAMKPKSSLWTELEPMLDEALEKLDETDRTAVLLRFFENKSLREVGAAFGASEEAAQKRVSRAIERLRTIFAKRGIVVGSAGLVTELSAHAIQTAPVSLGASITSAAPLAGAVALLKTTEAIVMTTVQKSLLAAGLAIAVGGGLYEARELSRLRAEISVQQQRATHLDVAAKNFERERDVAAQKTAAADREIDALLAKAKAAVPPGQKLDPEMEAWLARVDRLKKLRAERPELAIPEFQLLEEKTWFVVAQKAKLDSDSGVKDVFASLRGVAENSFANLANKALKNYLETNGGVLPAAPEQLAPFFEPPADPALFQRYRMLHTGKFSEVPKSANAPVLAVKSPVDLERDSIRLIGPGWFSSVSAMSYNVREARAAFAKTNPGQQATTADQLIPFLPFPAPSAAIQKFFAPPSTAPQR